jgi:hypothetical protein
VRWTFDHLDLPSCIVHPTHRKRDGISRRCPNSILTMRSPLSVSQTIFLTRIEARITDRSTFQIIFAPSMMFARQHAADSATEQESPRTPDRAHFSESSSSSGNSSSNSSSSNASREPPSAPKQLSHRNQRSKSRPISPTLLIAGRRLRQATSSQTRSSPYPISSAERNRIDVTRAYGDHAFPLRRRALWTYLPFVTRLQLKLRIDHERWQR